ncbi:hypothetical protein KV205_17405 [Streptomyces sp. SKN60]|uniref:hypothetical protein n=1 Tax=Streptomyces sp. SKN60 TaxID=2855506 RepID=UPI0022480CE9|nr:hypothetical protein [Streptomyces sp. SKN60]MCX2182293.1 hypothetical protein [Streptomyces sp. SKN60]
MTPDEPDDDPDLDLRAAFAAAACDITPGPVPLAEVRRRGLALRRRRAVALAAFAVLAVSGAAAVAGLALPVGPEVAAAPPVTAAATTPVPPAPLPPAIRVVRPGERVAAGKGWTVWLTAEGKHWSGPDGYANTRSVTDGNIALSEPGISYQREGGREGVFHSGLYYGTRSVGRVELRDPDGGTTVLATLLELPGRPGWGVWYAYTAPAARDLRDPREVTDPRRDQEGLADVLLYDRAGRRLAELPGIPSRTSRASRTVSEP